MSDDLHAHVDTLLAKKRAREGLCECGCGQTTRVPATNNTEKGWKAGVPLRFVNGHNGRLAVPYLIEDRGYQTPCWVWQGASTGDNGYGRTRVNGKARQAHRWYYEQAKGPVPEGLQLDHLCRVPLCVNPDHLEPVTGTENVRRGNVAKLTMEQAQELRAFRDEFFAANPLNAKGEPRQRFPQGVLGELSARYGVAKLTIIGVLRDRQWL